MNINQYLSTLESKGEVRIKDKNSAEILAKQSKANIWVTNNKYVVYKPIEYTKNGVIKYNPRFHKKGSVWKDEDLKYLIDWYNIIGPEELSFALERTPNSVMQKVGELRKKGLMNKPTKEEIERREIYEEALERVKKCRNDFEMH